MSRIELVGTVISGRGAFMKSTIQVIVSFLLLCSYSMVFGEARQNDCGLNEVKQKFTDLAFIGPFSLDKAKSMYADSVSGNETDRMEKDWNTFIENASRSGCVYFFSSDAESWKLLRGVKGFALIDNGKALEMVITSKS